ncbi:leucyl-tRNA synthetase [Ereboglobus sp. PH5-10]|uniref:leucine--tRNA ligase n=1 Tax=Ereboglobus sp. PH5-10 TaxID=2940629 RepID=UPI002405B5B3|nr:leucine--tRNA ligase [Ereboglobus sp. PH5-10]MDF9826964.1 leucyl-tRNA synthetase [Ereboglobus sp. PH5-10]
MATNCTDYDFSQIEPHWQKIWDENKTFRTSNDTSKPKFYVLDMFPYPSGSGLHIGHPEGYTATDIITRARRAQGQNVLHPIGWDAFGLPAEQHAVKTGAHPATNTQANITAFRRQLKALGFAYDWDRQVDTTDPKYYKWTQWIFLQLFKRGLAYVDERPVWWCPELRTVLANEEVIDGKSEVGKFPVERRNLRQWVLRITAYAERLLADLAHVDWPDSTKRMQEAWIGRSEGAEIVFSLEPGTPADAASPGGLKVFTTRPDTLYGATYMVIAPEHPLVDALTTPENRDAVAAYRKQAAAKSDLDRTDLAKDKSGIFSGSHAINPVNGARIPIWIADYVLMGYGTGAIMAVPAHDHRDWEFAKKFALPIIPVVQPPAGVEVDLEKASFEADGTMVNSAEFDGLPVGEAKKKITAKLAAQNRGKPTVNYKLRDWLFSRQRYWGEPFPIVWVSEADYKKAAATRAADLPPQPVTYKESEVRSQESGVNPSGSEAAADLPATNPQTWYALPLPESALPLTLPEIQNYLPSGTGESPLANASDWLEIWFNTATGEAVPATQPKPDGDNWARARRETNTMPQWAGSCWYYLRYLDPQNENAIADPALLKYWGVPDLYVGGAEHAVLHLLYARFWHKVLFDIGVVPQNEPFTKLFHQGIILGEDGEKMSKSRGNTVNPDDIIKTHGADSLRLYLMFLGPLEAMKPWNPQGIEGVHRFLQKVWREVISREGGINPKISADAKDSDELVKLLHETIKKVTDDIEGLRFNTAISAMMIFSNALQKAPAVSTATVRAFIQLLAPFAPHMTAELWSRLGETGPVLEAPWPKYDPAKLVVTEQKIVIQVNGKKRGEIMLPVGATQDTALAAARENPDAQPHLAGKEIKKVIYVPGRILNLVVG